MGEKRRLDGTVGGAGGTAVAEGGLCLRRFVEEEEEDDEDDEYGTFSS